MDIHQFFLGNAFDAHTYFGAHVTEQGVVFRTLAPNAAAVDLIWEGGDWEPIPMQRIHDGGVYELTVPEAVAGQMYKYRITPQNPDGDIIDHCDPYGFGMELRPNNASIIRDLSSYTFHDKKWLAQRGSHRKKPVNIYEVHLGSWRTNPNNPNGWYTYEEIAPKLVDYVKKAGYNYIEFMPLSEHPADCSWGYQNTGFFAPTSRYGTPQDFMYFVDRLHADGIGVIIDWVPAHFPRDEHGLRMFDGAPCFEGDELRMAEHPDWGTMIFDYSRPQVQSFLTSSAMFFFDKYHVDGIRVDAVSSMLYLDYGRRQGEWTPNKDGGNINLGAVDFLRKMNSAVLSSFPGAITIAEESTAFPLVSRPPEVGGLGFVFKWDMGFMHDTLDYMAMDPYFRSYNHSRITFSMMYAFSENFVLAFSHDEVVHGKASMVNKMWGDYDTKFASLRALYGYQFAHPGKKLMFMGQEFAQFKEWNYKTGLDWDILKFPEHSQYQSFVKAMNKFYLDNKPLWEIDYDWSGFSWISNDDNKNSVIVFRRIASNGDELIAVCNFLPTEHEQYSFGVPYYADYKEVFTTDDKKFGGDSDGNASYTAKCEGMHGLEYSITMKIPAMSAVFLKPVNKRSPESDKPKPEKAKKPAKTAEKKAETQVQKTAQKTAAKSGASAKKPAAKKTNTANRKKNGKAKK